MVLDIVQHLHKGPGGRGEADSTLWAVERDPTHAEMPLQLQPEGRYMVDRNVRDS
jgi:hypothetical protein